MLQQLLGGPGLNLTRANSNGSVPPVHENVVCTVTKASGITSMAAWLDAKTPVKLGGTAPGSPTDDVPKIPAATLGLPLQLIAGYKGTAEIRLAADGGEIAGGCWAWDGQGDLAQSLETGDDAGVLQVTPKAHRICRTCSWP